MNGWMGNLVGVVALAAIGGGTVSGAVLMPIRQQAEVTTDALTVMTAVRQTGQAATLAKTIDGDDIPMGIRGVSEMVEKGWLREAPRNPRDPNPAGMAVVRPLGGRTVVGMSLPRAATEVCDEISKRSGLGWPAPVADVPVNGTGCVMTSSGPVAYETV